MNNAFNLGRLFGIQFRIHYTWFIIFALVTVSLVHPNYLQWIYWTVGIVTSLLLFASVTAHELAHSLVGRANGLTISSITLFIFGGVARMTEEVRQPGAEFKMAIAGPLCSLVIGFLFGLVWYFAPGVSEPMATMILWLAITNGTLAAFNLIPGFPLDGGRVFRSALWHFTGNYIRSSRIATRMGQVIGFLFIIGGLLAIFLHPFGMDWYSGIWIMLVGWFLSVSALESYHDIRRQEQLLALSKVDITTNDTTTPPGTGSNG